MMKAKCLILLLLLGCKKVEKTLLDSEQYRDLIGTWTTDYPSDEERKIVIHKNGKIELFKSTERGDKFRISEIKYEPNKIIYEDDTLNIYSMSSHNNKYPNGYVSVIKKLYSDTAYIGFGAGRFIKDYEVDTNVTTFKIVYIRN